MPALAIAVTARENAELIEIAPPPPLAPLDVHGPTLVTLMSPGTELAWNYLGEKFPSFPGYAAVFRVTRTGDKVADLHPGDLAFTMGPHRSFQQSSTTAAIPLPPGLEPERAVLARLMGVSMTTLMTTAARPGDIVLVTGAGPVGYLAAHIFRVAGYDVAVVEPHAGRREAVAHSGISRVFDRIPLDNPALTGHVALVVECSGHEQAVLDGCRIVRKGGEVVLVGVPWRRLCDLSAHELLHAIFHHYSVLRSGWEWELPRDSADFRPHSIRTSMELALKWLAEGKVPADGLCEIASPRDAQAAYQANLTRRNQKLFTLFDWSRA